MTPKALNLIRGLRGASYDALADVVEEEITAQDEENAALRLSLENLCDAVVIEGSDPCSLRVRTMTNRALDLLIVLDEKDLKGSTPRA